MIGYPGKPGLVGVWCCLVAGILIGSAGRARADGTYRFLIPAVEADAGENVRLTIQGEYEESVQGFSMAFRYPSSDVTVERVHIEDTILEAIGTDYVEILVSEEAGTVVIGVLVDARPPFEGRLIPAIGQPLDFVHLELSVSPEADDTLVFQFEDNLSMPPVNNLYSVNNESVPVTEYGEGFLHVRGATGAGGEFVRGDFNRDRVVDISDPIEILSGIFLGSGPARCLVAGDANDDEQVDISDPIYLLKHLFQDGPPLPPPGIYPGEDPTPGPLGCDEPLLQ